MTRLNLKWIKTSAQMNAHTYTQSHHHTHTYTPLSHPHIDTTDWTRDDPLAHQNSHIHFDHSLNSRCNSQQTCRSYVNEIKKKMNQTLPTFHSACKSQWILYSETCALTLEAASLQYIERDKVLSHRQYNMSRRQTT